MWPTRYAYELRTWDQPGQLCEPNVLHDGSFAIGTGLDGPQIGYVTSLLVEQHCISSTFQFMCFGSFFLMYSFSQNRYRFPFVRLSLSSTNHLICFFIILLIPMPTPHLPNDQSICMQLYASGLPGNHGNKSKKYKWGRGVTTHKW